MRTKVTTRATAVPLVLGLVLSALAVASPALANHPVFVEGNCFGPGSGMTATGLMNSPVLNGTCGDYDGDGRIRMAEDLDGDNNFGTINAALAAVAQNGRVTIVANGTFPEVVVLKPTEGGNVSLEAARGVDANIDAVVQGEPGNEERATRPGIVIRGCDECRTIVRNVMVRNWRVGILVRRDAHAILDEVRVENNLDYGIHAVGRSRVTITDSDVSATGFRKGTAGVGEADPGRGVEFEDRSRGSIVDTTVSGSADAGISVLNRARLEIRNVHVFDNHPNFRFRGTSAN